MPEGILKGARAIAVEAVFHGAQLPRAGLYGAFEDSV
jgi:hypothetical protein